MGPKFIFIRHGEAEHNVAFHEVGESAFTNPLYQDAVLTKKGIEQARETAKQLFSYKIIDLWSSPLTRALQTSEELFEELNIQTMYVHDNLLERLGGAHICNKRASKSVIKKKFFAFQLDFLADLPPEWIDREPQLALAQRMRMFILQLADLYKNVSEDYHIVIVGHGDALSSLTGKPFKNGEFVVMTLEELPQILKIEPA
jgi:broad specificity phosphatase PhoE